MSSSSSLSEAAAARGVGDLVSHHFELGPNFAELTLQFDVQTNLERAVDEAAAAVGGAETEFDPAILADLVNLFNEQNEGMIKDYDYRVHLENASADGPRAEICVLFKHVLKRLGEPQRYAHFDVQFMPTQRKVVFFKKSDRAASLIRLASDVEFMPVKNVVLTYTLEANVLRARLNFTSTRPSAGAAATENDAEKQRTLRGMMEEMFRTCIESARTRIRLKDGRLTIS